MDWYTEGYWNVYPHISTAKQYLEDGYIPADQTPPLTQISRLENGIHIIKDLHNQTEHKAITLGQFKEMDFDVLICSIPQHVEPFLKLKQFHPNAKLVFQMGNRFENTINNMHLIPNLLASIKPFEVPPPCNAVFYRQEFDLNIFNPSTNPPEKTISSFVNIYDKNGGFQNYIELKLLLIDWDFRSYGAQNENGVIDTTLEMAQLMKKSAWGFMVKAGADGYGHVLHNWFACGRPVIINYSDYKKELGGDLLIPNETCLVAEVGQSMDNIANLISNMPPHQYEWMCSRVREKFREIADFDKDEIAIRQWLSHLI